MRVLVTGSRDWQNRDTVWKALTEFAEGTGTPLRDVVVVQGECPTGADHDAYLWTLAMGAKNEPYPPDWERHGRRAPLSRNRRMVNLGADICLAFHRPCTSDKCPTIALHGSHGTGHTIGLARAAHIPTTIYKEGW
jgi:hypothetical protein